MFLRAIREKNPALVEYAMFSQQKGRLLPDTYVIDLDILSENIREITAAAGAHGIRMYYMLKQAGRNPVIARMLEESGFDGAVAVDYKEALFYAQHGIRMGHAGHLVQIPAAALNRVLDAKPEIVTVYSVEKARQVGDTAASRNRVQDIMLRVVRNGDIQYSGQAAGPDWCLCFSVRLVQRRAA